MLHKHPSDGRRALRRSGWKAETGRQSLPSESTQKHPRKVFRNQSRVYEAGFLFLDRRISYPMSLRALPRAVCLRSLTTHATRPRTQLSSLTRNALTRTLGTTPVRRDRSFMNVLADEHPPPVQVDSISEEGILLADGLLLPSSCIFFDGHVFLWDVPQNLWEGWGPERFEFFEATLNRPGLYIPPPQHERLLITTNRNSSIRYRTDVCAASTFCTVIL
jgi:hypothetical protein